MKILNFLFKDTFSWFEVVCILNIIAASPSIWVSIPLAFVVDGLSASVQFS